jgi:hypothetical protein
MEEIMNNEHRYDDIIKLPHHVSATRPQMSMHDRAAQFSPFAALTGYDDAVEETARLTDEQAELLAYSCVIDNGDQEGYQSTEFPTAATFNLSNLYDRLLSCAEVTGDIDTVQRVVYDELTQLPQLDANGDTVYAYYPVYYNIEKTSRVIITDLEASNGWMHVVADVIAPTSDLIFDVIQKQDNMKIMGRLLRETGIWAWMNQERDKEYEQLELPETYDLTNVGSFEAPLKRYLAYTGFVEKDEIFYKYGVPEVQLDDEGNITNWEDVLSGLLNISRITTA